MKRFLRFCPPSLIVLLLCAPGRAATADLAGQFPDAPTRNQCSVGSCHIFGSIGLLEAAIYRQHGQRTRLSEMDLFVQKMVASKAYLRRFEEKMQEARSSGANPATIELNEFGEGGWPEKDLSFAIANGVATNDTISYESAEQNYENFRKLEKNYLDSVGKNDKDYHDKAGAIEAWFYDHIFSTSQSDYHAEKSNQHIIANMLLGGPENIKKVRAEREKVKKLVADFKVSHKTFSANRKSSDCAKDGEKVKTELVSRLTGPKPMPVAVAMDLAGVWGQTDTSRDANHAFIIQGVAEDAGKLVFKTRNSWGSLDTNYDVHENELCRIFGVYAVETPKDKS